MRKKLPSKVIPKKSTLKSMSYHTHNWSSGYFSINQQGHMEVVVTKQKKHRAELHLLVKRLLTSGAKLPILLRFTDILQQRVQQLTNAFKSALNHYNYTGSYTCVYPIKVNQQRQVIHSFLTTPLTDPRLTVGLEAGSKPELLAVLGMSQNQNTTIICNGYKDQAFIRLALIGQQLGYRIFIVIEKPSELPIILAESRALQVQPRLGVRIRLSTVAKSYWQNTGGESSKFGLSADQLLTIFNTLKVRKKLHLLKMLHVHMGSQISDIQELKQCLTEVARYYVEVNQMGATLNCIDVGGGLGIDYEGSHSNNTYSMNYCINSYAFSVISVIKEACDKYQLPYPEIITESGRALTAHHTLLVTNIVDIERVTHIRPEPPAKQAPAYNQIAWQNYLQILAPLNNQQLKTYYTKLQNTMDQAEKFFLEGSLTLKDKAYIQQCYYYSCNKLLQQLEELNPNHQTMIKTLEDRLADKVILNLSIFQSLPDIWGIKQIFPILPLSGLNQTNTTRAKLYDMTCDSDGRIDHYANSTGVESSIPLPHLATTQSLILGIFLVGAYQEILGDRHNLFGDTDCVNIYLNSEGNFTFDHIHKGDSVAGILDDVNLNANHLLFKLSEELHNSCNNNQKKDFFLAILNDIVWGYTYLS